ncbi:hypothetical protein B0H67DRAFT_670331, partial [Lasiosphaeris hirsuta]
MLPVLPSATSRNYGERSSDISIGKTGSQAPSYPFLSAFSDEQHAYRWACSLPHRWEETRANRWPLANFSWQIYKIDTAKLPPSTLILDMEKLPKRLNFTHPWPYHEVLIFRGIPRQALVD